VQNTLVIGQTNQEVLIDSGEFLMGSNDVDEEGHSPHLVFTDPYYIDKYEVTISQYEQCVIAKKCTERDSGKVEEKYRDYPMYNVSWYDAQKYCSWQNKRLPTEAEWEKAARGKTGRLSIIDDTKYSELEAIKKLKLLAAWGRQNKKAIGSFPSDVSDYGVYDMVGNVHEWVQDWYSEGYYKESNKENPQGPSTGTEKVIRGSAAMYGGYEGFTAFVSRWHHDPNMTLSYLGFRCARSAK